MRRQTEIIKRLLRPIGEEKLENQDKRQGSSFFWKFHSRLVHLENVGNSYQATISCNVETGQWVRKSFPSIDHLLIILSHPLLPPPLSLSCVSTYITSTYICPRRSVYKYALDPLPRKLYLGSTYLKSSFRSYFLAANISALLPALYRKALPRHMKHPPIFRANNP